MKITGKDVVRKNIERALAVMVKQAEAGLMATGVKVRERGMRITPVDTSNLIGSWYGPVIVKRQPIVVEIGLTAYYAPFVHEMAEAKFQKPGAQAKFLENPLKEVMAEMLGVIASHIKRANYVPLKSFRHMWG